MAQWLFIRDVIDRRKFINTFGQGIQSEDSYQKLSCLHDKVNSQKSINFHSSIRTRQRLRQICSRSRKMSDIKEGLHVSPKPFRIFYMQAIKTPVGLK